MTSFLLQVMLAILHLDARLELSLGKYTEEFVAL